MVDLSPASDHLTGVVLVQLMKAKPREHDLALSYSFLVHQEPNWSERKESCCDVDNSLKMFWEIEKSGTDRDERLVLTEKIKQRERFPQVQKCKISCSRSLERNKPDIPDTKPVVLSRVRSAKRNLTKNSHVAEEYQATIQAYVAKGYLRKVPLNEQLPAYVWCLPHFSVMRKDTSATKCEWCLTVPVNVMLLP